METRRGVGRDGSRPSGTRIRQRFLDRRQPPDTIATWCASSTCGDPGKPAGRSDIKQPDGQRVESWSRGTRVFSEWAAIG
jgi:hypothetical protein